MQVLSIDRGAKPYQFTASSSLVWVVKIYESSAGTICGNDLKEMVTTRDNAKKIDCHSINYTDHGGKRATPTKLLESDIKVYSHRKI